MRILQVCVDLDGGGIDRYLYNYCSRIEGIQFDFVIIDSGKKGILEDDLKRFGYEIYRVPRISKGWRDNYRALKRIMNKNVYDAVHVHLGNKSFIAVCVAKKCGIKTRIVHAHIANVPENFKDKVVRKIGRLLTKRYATDLAACGVDAAKWVWGTRTYEKKRISIHNNAIETHKYLYNVENNKKHREELKINENALVVGHVGRLCDQKNQLRLLDIYHEIHLKCPDSCLLLIGQGEQENEIKTKIQLLGLESNVKLLGIRNDVPALLSCMDVFVFPSKYEGLPFTLIETQCSGLRALSSDAVTKDVKVSDCVEFLSLGEDNQVWSQKAIELIGLKRDLSAYQKVVSAGYDIYVESKKLKKYYMKTAFKR